jgi:hypothetical protein
LAHSDIPLAPTTGAIYRGDGSIIISPFSPTRGKDFFLSVWIKKTGTTPGTGSSGGGNGSMNLLQQLSHDYLPAGNRLPSLGTGGVLSTGILGGTALNSDVTVKATSTTGAVTTLGNFQAAGNLVDGWQQLTGKFTVPMDAASITVEMRATNGKVWFDDLRIQPFNSVMKAFVYHPLTLRLMATLDENNYASFYVYDQQGQLVATKKETEDGIFTVQEARNGTSKIVRP